MSTKYRLPAKSELTALFAHCAEVAANMPPSPKRRFLGRHPLAAAAIEIGTTLVAATGYAGFVYAVMK